MRSLTRIADGLTVVREGRSDGAADDEHDPEGPTMAAEWSRLTGGESDLRVEVAAIDAAIARIDAGEYGICIRCGRAIGAERLRARPEAELCIDCARLLERSS